LGRKILIIEDDKNIADIIKHNLKKEGFSVIEAYDGEQGLEMGLNENPDLILLDIMLPKMDGFTVCKKLRQSVNTPIIMITAREEELDKVLGLELGADDYITKPFSYRELIARIKANLRRYYSDEDNANKDKKAAGTVKYGDLIIDFDRYEVIRDNTVIELTLREFELVKFLALHQGQIFTRENLLEKVWDYEYYGDVRTVDVTVRRIREKLEKDPSNPQYILTKRGVGYYFNANINKSNKTN